MNENRQQAVLTQDLHARAGLLYAVLDAVRAPVIVFDRDGCLHFFNQECSRLTGFSPEDLLGRNVFDVLIAPEARETWRGVFDQMAAGDSPGDHECECLLRAGGRRRLVFRCSPLFDDTGRMAYVVATAVDMKDMHSAESAARATARQLQDFVDACPALVGELDCSYRFVFANPEYRRRFGLDPRHIHGQHASRVIGEAAFNVLKRFLDKALAGETVTYDGEISYGSGDPRTIHGVYIPRRNESGEVCGLYIMAVDLTEQYRLGSALNDAAHRSQAVLDTAIDGVITITPDGLIESFNHSAEKMFGYTAQEVIGRNVNMLMPEPHHSQHDGYLGHYLATGEKRIIGIGREVIARRKDGSLFPIELAVGEFEEHGERRFTGFTRDISDRKRAEAEARDRLNQLAHVTRVSAMGDLASGIAHEVNQPLTAITTTAHACLHLLRDHRASPEVVQRSLEQIARQAERASNVIHGMRNFLRKADERPMEEVDIRELLRDVLQLMQHEIRVQDVDVRLDMPAELPLVELNVVQIEQVMLNILRNAIEAMTGSATRRVNVKIRALVTEGTTVELVVHDTGPGVPPEIRERVFEPFVTSKSAGMGQGLSISRGIVRAHGGDLRLLEVECGACFSITLPAAGSRA